eukprot:TRINITY_DN16781_c0_g1_i1.p1 TRINITY_DN16781_c0_g1~~TRINITY_DN16781_c0_g1_i1.p1  ORF type:complete len:715 (-),score=99.47 TRINITY_DN16781_c0_g1_i1:422-2566(-)
MVSLPAVTGGVCARWRCLGCHLRVFCLFHRRGRTGEKDGRLNFVVQNPRRFFCAMSLRRPGVLLLAAIFPVVVGHPLVPDSLLRWQTDSQLNGPSSEATACDMSREEWREYYVAVDAATRATGLPEEGQEALALRAAAKETLANALLRRTKDVADVLTCNVGVVAGFYTLARLVSPLAVRSFGLVGAEDGAGLAYRLLQLALIFIFTLRNANRIPQGPGLAWGVTESSIIPAIMGLKKIQDKKARIDWSRLEPISPSFRDPNLKIAVVSICAYPEDHPLVIRKATPRNRQLYTRRHGYEDYLYSENPVLGAEDLGIQHAKLATVLSLLQTEDFDWVAWFDCDSILMNMNRTLDSIIFQYTQHVPKGDDEPAPVCGAPPPPSRLRSGLSGNWTDSWVPEHLRQEAQIQLWDELSDTGKLVIYGSARQIGDVEGRIVDGQLEIDFPDGRMRGHLVISERSGSKKLVWDNGSEWMLERSGDEVDTGNTEAATACREPIRTPSEASDRNLLINTDVNLLVTEEGWGLSSANWLIRRSEWSRNFLDNALTAAHAELRLFGDQDAMILHLMNEQSLVSAGGHGSRYARDPWQDPLDRHSRVVPQFELNSYDALNALTMECDTFVEGDLLVTFPQCKDESCNSLFNIALDYASDDSVDLPGGVNAGAWWLRSEGPIRWRGYDPRSSNALRVFGPRRLIGEVYYRERRQRKHDEEKQLGTDS